MNGRGKHCSWMGLVVGAVTLVGPIESGVADEPPLAGQIDRLVQPYLDESIAVGMVVGAIRGDESIVRGYGSVRRDQPEPPTGQTIYEIGSITKVFTGLLLAEAVVRGRVQLDQPVAELLPSDVLLAQHAEGPIRLRHLATHSSGLPRLPSNLAPAEVRDPYADYSREDLYTFLNGHSPARGPGGEPEYSNLAFGLLGQLLADQADRTYGELIQSAIAEPLEMDDTRVELTEAMQDRLAPAYNGELADDQNWTFQAMAGAGAVRSTVDDMLRFARAQLNPPEGPLGEAIELAWKVHRPTTQGEHFAMGLGWHVARDGVTRWHNGQTGGYHSMLLVHRPANVAVVVLANTATMEIDTLAEQLVRLLAGSTEEPRKFELTADVSPEQMQRLVGRYQLAPNFVLTVKIEEGALMVGASGQPFARVYPRSDTQWRYRVVAASLTFELEDEGPARAVVLHQGGLNQRAERLE